MWPRNASRSGTNEAVACLVPRFSCSGFRLLASFFSPGLASFASVCRRRTARSHPRPPHLEAVGSARVFVAAHAADGAAFRHRCESRRTTSPITRLPPMGRGLISTILNELAFHIDRRFQNARWFHQGAGHRSESRDGEFVDSLRIFARGQIHCFADLFGPGGPHVRQRVLGRLSHARGERGHWRGWRIPH